jgi:poly-gamma-glutamate capsule biosynthesis protein CapA/YwtB (metallophosphatase superfamily)
VLFLGDLCFGASYGRRSFRERGFDSSFRNLDPLLGRAALVVANLETTLTTAKSSVLEGKKGYIHKDDPEAADALRSHGIDVVSLANNHAFDYGASGLRETLESLGARDVTPIGAGLTGEQAGRSVVRDLVLGRDTFRVAVAAGKEYVRYRYDYYAGEERAGINGWIRRTAAAQIRALREAEPGAFVVAFPHWGRNYRWKINYQSKLARSMVRAGADLVVGHGAHCLQEIERVEGRWVVHSIGNSVFNTRGAFRKHPDILPYSALARLCLWHAPRRPVATLRLYPILSDNRRTSFRPRFVDDDELARIRSVLVARSRRDDRLDDALSGGQDEFARFLELPLQLR